MVISSNTGNMLKQMPSRKVRLLSQINVAPSDALVKNSLWQRWAWCWCALNVCCFCLLACLFVFFCLPRSAMVMWRHIVATEVTYSLMCWITTGCTSVDAQLVQTSYVLIEIFYISLLGDGLGTAVPKPLPGVVWDLALPASPPYQLVVSTYPKMLQWRRINVVHSAFIVVIFLELELV